MVTLSPPHDGISHPHALLVAHSHAPAAACRSRSPIYSVVITGTLRHHTTAPDTDTHTHTHARTHALSPTAQPVKSAIYSVVIMDGRGGATAKELARALRREGVYNAYTLTGGFSAWQSADLPTTSASDYSASAGDLLRDEAEALGSRFGGLSVWASEQFSDPATALPTAGGVLAGTIILANYATTLKVIGLWGLSWSLYEGITTGSLEAGIKAASKAIDGVTGKATPKPAMDFSDAGMQVTTGAYKPSPSTVIKVGEPEPIKVAEPSTEA
jgi:hypothetical protein